MAMAWIGGLGLTLMSTLAAAQEEAVAPPPPGTPATVATPAPEETAPGPAQASPEPVRPALPRARPAPARAPLSGRDASASIPPRATPADQLIFERAARRARERIGRLQARKWAGTSAQRPMVSGTLFDQALQPQPYWGWPGHYRSAAPFVPHR